MISRQVLDIRTSGLQSDPLRVPLLPFEVRNHKNHYKLISRYTSFHPNKCIRPQIKHCQLQNVIPDDIKNIMLFRPYFLYSYMLANGYI